MKWHLPLHRSLARAGPRTECVETIIWWGDRPNINKSTPQLPYNLFQGVSACIMKRCGCCMYSFFVMLPTTNGKELLSRNGAVNVLTKNRVLLLHSQRGSAGAHVSPERDMGSQILKIERHFRTRYRPRRLIIQSFEGKKSATSTSAYSL